jgi:hypothetical protein
MKQDILFFTEKRFAKSKPFQFVIPFFFLFLTLISISSFDWKKDDFPPTLKLETKAIEAIFGLEKGAKSNLMFTGEKSETFEMAGEVISHVSAGEKSGAMRLDLTYQNLKFKLLLNRKELNSKMQYQINLIQVGGKTNFRLLRSEKNAFVLERTALSNIVTE